MKHDEKVLAPWQTTKQSILLETPWFKIRKIEAKTPSGVDADYYIHDAKDSVICVCIDEQDRVIIERQYRPPVEKVSIDFPAGKMESANETPEDAIKRELREELGFNPTMLKKLAVLDKDPGLSSARIHVFLARGASTAKTDPDDTENIVSSLVPANTILNLVTSDEMTCPFCILAAFLAFKELGWIQVSI